MSNDDEAQRAVKRVKLADGSAAALTTPISAVMETPEVAKVTTDATHSREREVGILRWVNEKNPGFEGILKQR